MEFYRRGGLDAVLQSAEFGRSHYRAFSEPKLPAAPLKISDRRTFDA